MRSHLIFTVFVSLMMLFVASVGASVSLAQHREPLFDVDPPHLVSFGLVPQAINVAIEAQAITVTARITDNESGVSDGKFMGEDAPRSRLFFLSPSETRIVILEFLPEHRISGDSLDGIYQTSFVLPKKSELGVWKVNYFQLVDEVNNSRTVERDHMEAAGFPITFTVIAEGGDEDPPHLISLSIQPRTINVALTSREITFTTHITDNNSGLQNAELLFSWLDQQFIELNFNYSNRIAGTEQNGIYQIVIRRIDDSYKTGDWKASYFHLKDSEGNEHTATSASMEAMGFPISFTITSTVYSVYIPSLSADRQNN